MGRGLSAELNAMAHWINASDSALRISGTMMSSMGSPAAGVSRGSASPACDSASRACGCSSRLASASALARQYSTSASRAACSASRFSRSPVSLASSPFTASFRTAAWRGEPLEGSGSGHASGPRSNVVEARGKNACLLYTSRICGSDPSASMILLELRMKSGAMRVPMVESRNVYRCSGSRVPPKGTSTTRCRTACIASLPNTAQGASNDWSTWKEARTSKRKGSGAARTSWWMKYSAPNFWRALRSASCDWSMPRTRLCGKRARKASTLSPSPQAQSQIERLSVRISSSSHNGKFIRWRKHSCLPRRDSSRRFSDVHQVCVWSVGCLPPCFQSRLSHQDPGQLIEPLSDKFPVRIARQMLAVFLKHAGRVFGKFQGHLPAHQRIELQCPFPAPLGIAVIQRCDFARNVRRDVIVVNQFPPASRRLNGIQIPFRLVIIGDFVLLPSGVLNVSFARPEVIQQRQSEKLRMPVGAHIRNAQLGGIRDVRHASRLQQAADLAQRLLGVHHMFDHIAAGDQVEFLFAREEIVQQKVAKVGIDLLARRRQVHSAELGEFFADLDARHVVVEVRERRQGPAIRETDIQIGLARPVCRRDRHTPVFQLLHQLPAPGVGAEGVVEIHVQVSVTGPEFLHIFEVPVVFVTQKHAEGAIGKGRRNIVGTTDRLDSGIVDGGLGLRHVRFLFFLRGGLRCWLRSGGFGCNGVLRPHRTKERPRDQPQRSRDLPGEALLQFGDRPA